MAVRHDTAATEYQYRDSGLVNHNAPYAVAFRAHQATVVSSRIWVITGSPAPGGSAYETADMVGYNAGNQELLLIVNGVETAGAFTWADNTYVDLIVVRESVTVLKLYANGTLVVTATTASVAGRAATAHEILGTDDTAGQWLNGRFEGYCAWSVGLNATEAATQSGYLNPAVQLTSVVTETRMTGATVALANVSEVGTNWISAPNDAALSIEAGSGAAIFSGSTAPPPLSPAKQMMQLINF